MRHFGVEIKKRRKQLGMTQQEIVEGFMSISKLSNIENGKTDLDPQTWEYLKQKLGMDHSSNDKKMITETIDKLIAQAQSYYQAGLIEKSIARLQEAIQLSEKKLLFYKTAYAYRELGHIYMDQRDYLTAIKLLERAVSLFENSKDTEMVQTCKVVLGVIYYKQEKYSQSINHFLEMIEPVSESLKGAIYYNLASAYYKVNDFDNANYACEKALMHLPQEDRSQYLLPILILQSILLYRVKMFLLAKEKLHQAKELALKYNNIHYLAKVWHNLGDIELSCENYEQAQEYFLISLELKEKIDDRMGIARTKSVMAKLHLEMGDMEVARNLGIESLKLARQQHLKSEELLCLVTLTKIYALSKDEFKFLDTSYKAIQLCNELEFWPIKIELYDDIALFFYKNKNHTRCIDYLYKAFKARHQITDT